MITLPLIASDLDELRAFHDAHYKDEFPFPNFTHNFISTFKIIGDNGKVITAGGVKLFPEVVLITDKDASAHDRAFALTSALQISTLCASNMGHALLYASAQESKWQQQLLSVGFRRSVDHNYVIG